MSPDQVRSLYGPLLACVTASKSAFEAMVRQHSPDGTVKTFVGLIRDDPKGREAEVYRCTPLPGFCDSGFTRWRGADLRGPHHG
jgi:molybdopterin synthase catalytic subunit